jgi:hypothetical protein
MSEPHCCEFVAVDGPLTTQQLAELRGLEARGNVPITGREGGSMTSTQGVAFDVEQGLIELPGAPPRWVWAFTCPTPKCPCRVAVVLSAPGDREVQLRGR